jgi:TctA family transporter
MDMNKNEIGLQLLWLKLRINSRYIVIFLMNYQSIEVKKIYRLLICLNRSVASWIIFVVQLPASTHHVPAQTNIECRGM